MLRIFTLFLKFKIILQTNKQDDVRQSQHEQHQLNNDSFGRQRSERSGWIIRQYSTANGKSSLINFKEAFLCAFSGKLGCVKGLVVMQELDPDVKSVKQGPRPIAIHLRDAVSPARARHGHERAQVRGEQPCRVAQGH